jgi:predicted nucleotidyltransferase component of viral defense system
VNISAEKLAAEAAATGFRSDVLEKAVRLLGLLDALRSHPFLKEKLVLKGGTALNLFVFPVPRLSVDIDLNYVGLEHRDGLLTDRPRIEQALHAVFAREGFTVRRMPEGHAGGKWLLRYVSTLGRSGNLEVDVNFMFRLPLWPVTFRDSQAIGSWSATGIPMLDHHELAAGKLAALFARKQARDLFDSNRILRMLNLDPSRLRIGFVVYGAMNRKDWRTVSRNDVDFDATELTRQLVPMLRIDASEIRAESAGYGARLVQECRERLSMVLPFTDSERRFLDMILDRGVIDATLLTDDESLQARIQRQPLLEWKTRHIRR